MGNAENRRIRRGKREADRAAKHLQIEQTRREQGQRRRRTAAKVAFAALTSLTLVALLGAVLPPRLQSFDRDSSRTVEVYAVPKDMALYDSGVAGGNISLTLREERDLLQTMGFNRRPILRVEADFSLPWEAGRDPNDLAWDVTVNRNVKSFRGPWDDDGEGHLTMTPWKSNESSLNGGFEFTVTPWFKEIKTNDGQQRVRVTLRVDLQLSEPVISQGMEDDVWTQSWAFRWAPPEDAPHWRWDFVPGIENQRDTAPMPATPYTQNGGVQAYVCASCDIRQAYGDTSDEQSHRGEWGYAGFFETPAELELATDWWPYRTTEPLVWSVVLTLVLEVLVAIVLSLIERMRLRARNPNAGTHPSPHGMSRQPE